MSSIDSHSLKTSTLGGSDEDGPEELAELDELDVPSAAKSIGTEPPRGKRTVNNRLTTRFTLVLQEPTKGIADRSSELRELPILILAAGQVIRHFGHLNEPRLEIIAWLQAIQR